MAGASGANVPGGLPPHQQLSGAHHPASTPQPLASTTALALSSESLQNAGGVSSHTPAPGAQVVKVPVAGQTNSQPGNNRNAAQAAAFSSGPEATEEDAAEEPDSPDRPKLTINRPSTII